MLRKCFEILAKYYNDSLYMNSTKSALLGILMILYNTQLLKDSSSKDFTNEVFTLISKFLPKIVTKHSVLDELVPYLGLIAKEQRLLLVNSVDLGKNETSESILSFKIRMLVDSEFRVNYESSIEKMINLYFVYHSKYHRNLEKGERQEYDDLVILINELYEEHKDKASTKLQFQILSLNTFAHNISEYNYDITLKLINLCQDCCLFIKANELFKYMNLKSPQNETCSHIIFDFYNRYGYKQGVLGLVNNFNKWEGENQKSLKKTLFKLFNGRNFYFSSELLDFSQETDYSYYKHVLQIKEVLSLLEEKQLGLYDTNNTSNNDPNYVDQVNQEIEELKEMLENSKKKMLDYNMNNLLVKNQDLMVTMEKYSLVPESRPLLEDNSKKHQYKIDGINKNTPLYNYVPGYKSNYLQCLDKGIYSFYSDTNFLFVKLFEDRIFDSSVNNKEVHGEDIKNYSASVGQMKDLYVNQDKESRQSLFTGKFIDVSNSKDSTSAWVIRLTLENFKIISLLEQLNKEKSGFIVLSKYSNNKQAITLFLEAYKNQILDYLSDSYKNVIDLESLIQYYQKVSLYINYHFKFIFLFLQKTIQELYQVKKELKETFSEIKLAISNNFKSPFMSIFKEGLEFSLSNQSDLWKNFVEQAKIENEFELLSKEKNVLLEDVMTERREYIKIVQDSIKQRKTLVSDHI